MADEPIPTPADSTSPEPNEGFLHSLATSIGIDPEAVKSTAKAIWSNPVEAAKSIGGAQVDEFVDAAKHPVKTARLALNGVISSITNPEAQATARSRFNEPGFMNKLQGAEEYVTSGLPMVGGGVTKSEEQAGKGNLAGAAGTLTGTLGPLLTDTEGVQGIKEHVADTAKTFIESAKEEGKAALEATSPDSNEAGFAKLGGKKVRGATPKAKPAEPAPEPEPEQFADTGGKFVGKTPEPPAAPATPAEPYHPDLQKVIDLPGVTVHRDASQATDAAHFVTPDGKFVRLPAGLDHDKAIDKVRGESAALDSRISFLNDTGAMRIRPATDRAGKTLHVSVPVDGITPEQIDALKQSVGQGMKSRGNLILETADKPSDVKTAHQQVVSPRHIDDMAKEIGVHPDQAKPAEAPKAVVPEAKAAKQDIPEGSKMVPATPEEHRAELNKNPQAATLSDKTVEQLGDHKIFKLQTPDGKDAGITYHITPEGEAGGFVNNGPYKNATPMILQHAAENGAKTATAWDVNGKLPALYEKNGLKSVGSDPYDEAAYGKPSKELKTAWKAAGWKEGDPNPSIRHMEFPKPSWSAQAAAKAADGFSFNPKTGEEPKSGYMVEVHTEGRKVLDHPATQKDIEDFAAEHKDLLDKHPELHVGGFENELNISANVQDKATATRLAKTLDQKTIWDVAKKDLIDTKGAGERTSFENYPMDERMSDANGTTEMGPAGFENMPKHLYDSLQPDYRDFYEGKKQQQKGLTNAYHQIKPSLAETANSSMAGLMNKGWWQNFIDAFHVMGGGGEVAPGVPHAEALKQFHSAMSGNKAVEDAENLANNSYLDWIKAGKPTDRTSIDNIVRKNGAQPEGSEKKGNAAISDTRDAQGNILSPGLDTNKLHALVNSPEMRGEKPFEGKAIGGNPLAGKSQGAIKIPSMGALTAGEGNFNRTVLDAHVLSFYGKQGWNDATYIAHSVHMQRAAESIGLTAAEGQECQWGVIIALKNLMKTGLTAKEAAGKITDEMILQEGKDYAQIMKNSDENPAIFKELEKYGTGNPEDIDKGLTEILGRRPKPREETGVSATLLEHTAERIRATGAEKIGIKARRRAASAAREVPEETPAAPSAEDEGDTSFNFGENRQTQAEADLALVKSIQALKKPGAAADPIPKTLRKNINDTESMSDPDTRFNTARHEAGHAVISELLRPGAVQAVGLDDSGGYTHVTAPAGKTDTSQLTPDEIRNLVAVSYAGGMSEPGGTNAKHVGPDQTRRADILGGRASTMWQGIQRLATGGVRGTDPMTQGNQLQAEAKARVNALLADPAVRQHIDTLTTHIATKGSLSGDDVRAIMKPPTLTAAK